MTQMDEYYEYKRTFVISLSAAFNFLVGYADTGAALGLMPISEANLSKGIRCNQPTRASPSFKSVALR